MARPEGSTQAKPTKADIGGYYRMLKSAAGNDNILAAGLLVLNDTASRYVALHEKPYMSTPSVVRLAATAAAHLPRHEWAALPDEAADLADTMLRKMAQLVAQEDTIQ